MPSETKLKAKTSPIRLDFEAIGTIWNIEFEAHQELAPMIAELIAVHISEFDRTYSRFRADSWVWSVRKPGDYTAPADLAPMLDMYEQLYKITNGLVTPLIGDAMERAGYDSMYSLKPTKLRPIPELPETVELTDNTLHVKYECLLDFGAIGKGYLVDQIAELIQDQGITTYLIDAGGDIRVASPTLRSSTPVGLEDPEQLGTAIGIAELSNQSLCASAGSRRKWGEFHHIINPSTLRSTETVTATCVVAKTTMLADGLSTALFFTPPSRLQKEFEFEYVMQMSDNSIRTSDNFPGRMLAS